MEDRRSSFKRRFNPVSERGGGNKRGRFNDQFSESSQSSETVYRILCQSRKIGSVIGKGGGIVKALREETQSKITVADSVPGSEERVILIYSPSNKRPVNYSNGDFDLQCAAQDALLKVHDKIVEEDIVGGNDNESMVIARLLVPNNNVGCLLGKKGDVIQRLRSGTGASIRVLPSDQLPICAMTTDELVQISGRPSITRRALYEISTLLHQNPRKDKPPSSFPVSVNRPIPPPSNPIWAERGPTPQWAQPSRFGPVDFDSEEEPPPAEFSMKILCPRAKIGGVIGKGGSNVRQIQEETGTNIHVDDVADSEERVITVSSFEALWNPRSRTIDAILALQDKTSDLSEKGSVTTRLLIPSSKVGCLLGQGGQVINEMRRRTKADIRVYSKEEKPNCAAQDEELVQVSGSYGSAKDALGEIASRYRSRCLRDAKPAPPERPSPAGVPRFMGGGREYEPPSYAAPLREYSHPPPSREYEPRGYRAPPPPMEYEPRGYRAPPPPMEYEPHAYPSPQREYEPPNPTGYPGDLNLKMPTTGRLTEMVGTRPKLQGPYSDSIAEIHDNPYQGYSGQKRPLQSSYNDSYAPHPEPYADINPSHTSYTHTNPQQHPSYHNYQNNPPPPPQQGHYSGSPYQY